MGCIESSQARHVEQAHTPKLPLIVKEEPFTATQLEHEMDMATGDRIGAVDGQMPRHAQMDSQRPTRIELDQHPFGTATHTPDLSPDDQITEELHRWCLNHPFPIKVLERNDLAPYQLWGE
jgi:hypothetical protein